jgi:hypothetical protein
VDEKVKATIMQFTPKQKALLILKLRNLMLRTSAAAGPVKHDRVDTMPLSPAQEAIWLYEEMEPASRRFILPAAMELHGQFDFSVAQRAINQIILRHTILRTTIIIDDDWPFQKIHAVFTSRPEIIDLVNIPAERKGKAL